MYSQVYVIEHEERILYIYIYNLNADTRVLTDVEYP